MRVIRKSENTSVIEESEREPSGAQKRRRRSGEYVSRILHRKLKTIRQSSKLVPLTIE
jgi:hypothetical protein